MLLAIALRRQRGVDDVWALVYSLLRVPTIWLHAPLAAESVHPGTHVGHEGHWIGLELQMPVRAGKATVGLSAMAATIRAVVAGEHLCALAFASGAC
jgi:hypothetical protein